MNEKPDNLKKSSEHTPITDDMDQRIFAALADLKSSVDKLNQRVNQSVDKLNQRVNQSVDKLNQRVNQLEKSCYRLESSYDIESSYDNWGEYPVRISAEFLGYPLPQFWDEEEPYWTFPRGRVR